MSPIKLKITLPELPHKVVRTLLVPGTANFRQLHFMIQESLGWWNAHLFDFMDSRFRPKMVVSMPYDDDMEYFGPKPKVAHKLSVKKFLKETNGKHFWYWYDFGDSWWHHISVLKVTEKDKRLFKNMQFCIKAEGKCPPEDVGGVTGYSDFLEAVKDKDHPDYKGYRMWADLPPSGGYDEQSVDLDEVNAKLLKLYQSEFWFEEIYDMD